MLRPEQIRHYERSQVLDIGRRWPAVGASLSVVTGHAVAARPLRDLALDQYGYINPTDAEALGVTAIELRKIAQASGPLTIRYCDHHVE